jgi:phosphoribosylcarboxyaminoimidazole (NCAIR) mutase
MAQDPVTREEVAAMIAARGELGPEMEPAVIDSFLDRVEAAAEKRAVAKPTVGERASGVGAGLAIVSLGTGIPITAIAAEQGGVAGIALAWLGIVGVNVAHALRR